MRVYRAINSHSTGQVTLAAVRFVDVIFPERYKKEHKGQKKLDSTRDYMDLIEETARLNECEFGHGGLRLAASDLEALAQRKAKFAA